MAFLSVVLVCVGVLNVVVLQTHPEPSVPTTSVPSPG